MFGLISVLPFVGEELSDGDSFAAAISAGDSYLERKRGKSISCEDYHAVHGLSVCVSTKPHKRILKFTNTESFEQIILQRIPPLRVLVFFFICILIGFLALKSLNVNIFKWRFLLMKRFNLNIDAPREIISFFAHAPGQDELILERILD